MPMHFGEFVTLLDGPIHAAAAAATLTGPTPANSAAWTVRERMAEIALVPPQNVSLTLAGSQPAQTTWYPIDAALVAVVSRRIAHFLSEA